MWSSNPVIMQAEFLFRKIICKIPAYRLHLVAWKWSLHFQSDSAIVSNNRPTLFIPAKAELKDFAAAVTERFKNPFIDHALLSISLNSTSKWKARVMPPLKKYVERKGTLPACITASFAFYIAFYNGYAMSEDGLTAKRAANEYTVKDDKAVLEFYLAHKDDSAADLVHAVCTNTSFWGEDLTQISGFEAAVCNYLTQIRENGAYEVMKALA